MPFTDPEPGPFPQAVLEPAPAIGEGPVSDAPIGDAAAVGEHDGGAARRPPTGRRRRGVSPLIGMPITLLAIFGALTAGMALKEGSMARGGVVIDGWIAGGVAWTRETFETALPHIRAAATRAEAAALATGEAIGDAWKKTVERLDLE